MKNQRIYDYKVSYDSFGHAHLLPWNRGVSKSKIFITQEGYAEKGT